jgi:hypothetical protein
MIFDKAPPFTHDQLQSHLRTIGLRRELGSVERAATNREFSRSLYVTLQKWRIGQRLSRLIPEPAFADVIASRASDIAKFEVITIDNVDAEQIAPEIWALIDSLTIVDNKAKMVAGSKALHHLLPDLIVPIDRRWTGTFFGLHKPEFQGQYVGQQRAVSRIFLVFARIARETPINSFIGTGRPWRTSRSKIIDNAIIGFCIDENLPEPS